MATFIKLINYKSSEQKEKEYFNSHNKFYINNQNDFFKIPGSPIAYWISRRMLNVFVHEFSLNKISKIKSGLSTGDNERFVRFWQEISFSDISFSVDRFRPNEKTQFTWVPYNKGGESRKWFGNNSLVVYWKNGGCDLRNTAVFRNPTYYFKEGLTWSGISSGNMPFRYVNSGFIFDSNKGPMIFLEDTSNTYLLLGLLNTKIICAFVDLLNPTISTQVGDLERVPVITNVSDKTSTNVSRCITLSKADWDSYETSWDFTKSPLLYKEYHQITVQETYTKFHALWLEITLEMQRLEVENNRIFIEAYGLQDELTPDVPLSEITLICNPHYRYNRNKSEEELDELLLTDTIKEFISYAVGCMFGRYSPDKEGLILANKGETIKDFKEKVPAPSFMPDDDNIIPVLEDEYFKDDIVSRFKEFLKITFGAESLAENLDFIAGALSKSKKGGDSSENIIREYFLKSFFKDHARTYQKRPIYWLFTSGKGRGFNAMVYMHRYDKTLLAKMRTDYLLELEAKLDARMGMLSESPQDKQEKERLGKLMQELAAYDEKLNNKALAFIDIDLDDGVAVNYVKFEGLVEGV